MKKEKCHTTDYKVFQGLVCVHLSDFVSFYSFPRLATVHLYGHILLPLSLHLLFSLEHSSTQLASPSDLSLNMASFEKPTSNP